MHFSSLLIFDHFLNLTMCNADTYSLNNETCKHYFLKDHLCVSCLFCLKFSSSVETVEKFQINGSM